MKKEVDLKTMGKIPEIAELKDELAREKNKHRFRNIFTSTIYTLVIVAAFSVLVATLWMPVLQIYGNSMTPTLEEGQIVISMKNAELETGDLVAFYMGNKLLVKRLIAEPMDSVSMDKQGNVFLNGVKLEEPYVSKKSLSPCDMTFPYQIPESRYFLLGDHRETSVDSRSNLVGCVSKEQIVGKIVFCVWPLKDFGPIK